MGVPAALLAAETARIAAALLLADRGDVDDLQRAIALDPRNPELHYRLGMASVSGAADDVAAGIASLQRAIQLQPNDATYWLGLAKACAVQGATNCAAQAWERATQLAPMNPRMEWEAASYYAVSGPKQRALGHLRQLLAMEPSSADAVFQLTWRAYGDPEMVWNELIAPSHNTAVACAYLTFLGEENRVDLAASLWGQLMAAGEPEPMTFSEVEPYLQLLLNRQRYAPAIAVWRDLLRLGVIPRPEQREPFAACREMRRSVCGNLLYNADFQQPMLNAGFDWQRHEVPYVAVAPSPAGRSCEPGRESHCGLRIDFTVAHNSEDEPISQLVPVIPGMRYLLKAWLRSEAVTSDSGPRLRVVDPSNPRQLDAATDGVTGTTPWHETSLQFTAGASPVIRISVWRPRSRSYPTEISGRAWVGDLWLQAIP